MATVRNRDTIVNALKDDAKNAIADGITGIFAYKDTNENNQIKYAIFYSTAESNDFEFNSPNNYTEKELLWEKGVFTSAGATFLGEILDGPDWREKYQLKRDKEAGGDLEKQLFDACKVGDVNLMKDLIDRGANVNAKAHWEFVTNATPLFIVAESGYVEAAKLLITKGAKVNITFDTWPLIIHIAGKGNVAMLKALIDAGADINAVTPHGVTALDKADYQGHKEAVQFLRSKGAKQTIKTAKSDCLDYKENADSYFLSPKRISKVPRDQIDNLKNESSDELRSLANLLISKLPTIYLGKLKGSDEAETLVTLLFLTFEELKRRGEHISDLRCKLKDNETEESQQKTAFEPQINQRKVFRNKPAVIAILFLIVFAGISILILKKRVSINLESTKQPSSAVSGVALSPSTIKLPNEIDDTVTEVDRIAKNSVYNDTCNVKVKNNANRKMINKINNIFDSVYDADGNKYYAVKIGKQVWTTVNLKTTKYSDGSQIPLLTMDTEWDSRTSPGYCYYDNNNENMDKYGVLYNWYTVNTGILAPKGWHVPTKAEWNELKEYLIVNGYNWNGTKEDNKIAKSLASNTNWKTFPNPGTIGCNLSNNNYCGFSAFPGGVRSSGGKFNKNGLEGCWWSSSELLSSTASGYSLSYDTDHLLPFDYSKSCGFSVRLLRD